MLISAVGGLESKSKPALDFVTNRVLLYPAHPLSRRMHGKKTISVRFMFYSRFGGYVICGSIRKIGSDSQIKKVLQILRQPDAVGRPKQVKRRVSLLDN